MKLKSAKRTWQISCIFVQAFCWTSEFNLWMKNKTSHQSRCGSVLSDFRFLASKRSWKSDWRPEEYGCGESLNKSWPKRQIYSWNHDKNIKSGSTKTCQNWPQFRVSRSLQESGKVLFDHVFRCDITGTRPHPTHNLYFAFWNQSIFHDAAPVHLNQFIKPMTSGNSSVTSAKFTHRHIIPRVWLTKWCKNSDIALIHYSMGLDSFHKPAGSQHSPHILFIFTFRRKCWFLFE